MDQVDPKKVLDEAFEAARKATDEYVASHPNEWYPCGFAWVRIPGRSPLVKHLKAMGDRRGGHPGYPKGWDIWNPSDHPTQSLDAKLVGARAFAEVLKKHGFEGYADSRWD